MSPTFRSRTARYARYSRSASRWSEPRALTNSRPPSVVTAANFLEPLVSTSAGRTEVTGRPARRSAAAISAGPIRRSGTPNATRTAAPTVTPVARARISCIGSTVPARSRAAAASSSVSQAARRHGRLSQGAAATTTAAADANSAGAGNAAPASQEPRARLAVSAAGRWPPSRSEDPLREDGGGHRPGGQPGQQPEPAPAERGGDHHGHRGQARHLDQAGDDPAGRAEAAGHGRGRAEKPPARDPRDGERAGEQRGPPRSAGSRLPGDGSGRTTGGVSRRHRDRRAAHRRSAGRAVSGTGGWAERLADPHSGGAGARLTASAASSAHEVPRRTPARASDSQWAPR